MTNRLFTFGCSFTKFHWPTWADILALEYDVSQNWGKTGAGNHFILYSLVEAIQRNNINKDDTIAVMFTSVAREDRWIRGDWATPGSVYDTESSKMSAEYIEKFTDPNGFVITSSAIIESVVRILQGIGCEYHLFSTVPITITDDSYLEKIFKINDSIQNQIQEIYSHSFLQIKPSMFEIIFDCDFNSRDHVLVPWARIRNLKILEKKYNTCAGKDWPSFSQFMQDRFDNVADDIVEEIDKQFDFFTWRNQLNTKRQDPHPTPMEHFEYLEKSGMLLNSRQKQFAEHWNHKVLNNEQLDWQTKTNVKRF
jgi:hypothetical protein